jgi:CheY-like chemotaxis protein
VRNRVLVIDDSPIVLEAVARVLEHEGYDVRISSDVNALAEAFGNWRPDLILTDVDMPGISGIDLCRKLKSSYDTAHVPVVLFSALNPKELADVARRCEADGFLSKESGLEALPQELAYLMQNTVF